MIKIKNGGEIMKKKLAGLLLLVLLICGTMLQGCGTAKSVENTTWKVIEQSDDSGTTIKGEELDKFGVFTYQFKSKGVLIVAVDGKGKEGTWSQSEENITINIDDNDNYYATIKNDKMILQIGKFKDTLEKQ
jgi:hypothetical protein